MEKVIKRFKNLSVVHLNIDGDIEVLAQRGMNLQCNITDGELTLISDDKSVIITKKIEINLSFSWDFNLFNKSRFDFFST